jgi:phasin
MNPTAAAFAGFVNNPQRLAANPRTRVMTEVTVTKTKAAKPAATMAALFELPQFELPKFEFPKFDLPKMDVPEGMREYAEKGIAQTREVYEKAKVTAEEATRVLEEVNRAYAKALADYNRAALEAGRTNLNAAFDWALALAKAASLNEAVEVSAAHMRTRFEALGEQGKELAALAQKAANDTAEPIKSGLSGAFKNVA